MKRLIMFVLIFYFIQVQQTFAQTSKEAKKEKALEKVIKNTEVEKLKKRSIRLRTKYAESKRKVKKWAKDKGELTRKIYSNGKISELQGFYKGKPLVYKTHNRVAAKTVSTNKVQPGGTSGLDLQGDGLTVGVWDGGIAYNLHSSFKETTGGPYHVFDYDDSTDYISDHATHVTGTILADGDDNNARGMAEKAVVHSYDWNNDISEMIEASIIASNPLLLSNHSYGRTSGWDYSSEEAMWYWYGDDFWPKDYSFG